MKIFRGLVVLVTIASVLQIGQTDKVVERIKKVQRRSAGGGLNVNADIGGGDGTGLNAQINVDGNLHGGGGVGGLFGSGANGGLLGGLLNSGGEGGFLFGLLDSSAEGHGLCGGNGAIASLLNSGGEGGFLGGFLNSGGNGNGLCGGLLNSGVEGGFLGGLLDSGADGNGLCGGKGPIAGFLNSGGEGGFIGGLFGDSNGGVNGDGGITVGSDSPSGLISIPIHFIHAVSGIIGSIGTGILNTVSSPITISGQIGASGLAQSPIIGPLSGTVYAGIQGVVHSPSTISNILFDGLEDIIEGFFGAATSPLTLSSQALNGGVDGIIESPFQVLPALSNNIAESISGVLTIVSSPLTISAAALDFGIDLTVNSAGGDLLPPSLFLALPDSLSRGIEALMTSPDYLADVFGEGFDRFTDGFLGNLLSPFLLSSEIYNGDLTLHMLSPLIFPEEFNANILQIIGGTFASPFYAMHALSAQVGISVSGILTTVLSPVALSGDLIDYVLNTDVSSSRQNPDESTIGLPPSIANGAFALMDSPISISSTISDSSHFVIDGTLGLITSPITTLSGYSPYPIPGSENLGPANVIFSPFQLAYYLANNLGLTLAGTLGLVSSPVTLSALLLRESVNLNVDSLSALPEQLELWGVPDSIGSTIASFLEVPFEGFLNVIGFFSSPLAILNAIGIANVPGSPSSPKIFPEDFPEETPDGVLLADYILTPPCIPVLSAEVPIDNTIWPPIFPLPDGNSGSVIFPSISPQKIKPPVVKPPVVKPSSGTCDLKNTEDLGDFLICLLNEVGTAIEGPLIRIVIQIVEFLLRLLGLSPPSFGLLTPLFKILSPK